MKMATVLRAPGVAVAVTLSKEKVSVVVANAVNSKANVVPGVVNAVISVEVSAASSEAVNAVNSEAAIVVSSEAANVAVETPVLQPGRLLANLEMKTSVALMKKWCI